MVEVEVGGRGGRGRKVGEGEKRKVGRERGESWVGRKSEGYFFQIDGATAFFRNTLFKSVNNTKNTHLK